MRTYRLTGPLIAEDCTIWQDGKHPRPWVAHTYQPGVDNWLGRGNARRLVDCWNACEGIEPSQLEAVMYAVKRELARDEPPTFEEMCKAIKINAALLDACEAALREQGTMSNMLFFSKPVLKTAIADAQNVDREGGAT